MLHVRIQRACLQGCAYKLSFGRGIIYVSLLKTYISDDLKVALLCLPIKRIVISDIQLEMEAHFSARGQKAH